MIRLALIGLVAAVAAPAVTIPIGGSSVRAGASLDAAAWTRLPHVSVTAVDHDGHSGEYEGIRIADVLRDAGAPVGSALRGRAARTYVVVSAQDGYAAVFSLGELETAESRCAPLFTESLNGSPLPAKQGPVQVIAACDRTHSRWVREVETVTVTTADSATTPAPAQSAP